MTALKIPKRISTALINSLSAGVVPRIGLEYVAVDRKEEIAALLQDLENISEAGAAFRFIVGRYGSGKSFLLQLIRNYAMERNFVVGDCDLSPERRLTGSHGQALGTYREIMRNLSTKTRPEGGALAAILERWFSTVQAQVVKESGMRPSDHDFNEVLEGKILEVVNNMEGMVHGFDFAAVLKTYWQGYRENDDTMKDSSLRWLRGEYSTKTEAINALGVRVIINDDSWYDYLKLFAKLVSDIGYKGMLVILDEAVSALDKSVEAQVLNMLVDLKEELGLTYVFISHDLNVVQYLSDRVLVMYLGKIVEIGPVEAIYGNPQHPYTRALLSAIPIPDPKLKRQRIILEGEPPSLFNLPPGCGFYDRCWARKPSCRGEMPPFRDIGDGHFVACFAEE